MFYWSHRDIHIVLSDEEELVLVQQLGKDAFERVGYHTSHKVRKEIERRIFRYLRDSLKADSETFRRRFVFRSLYGEEAQKMFPVLLEAYGRITRRATMGFHGEVSPLDQLPERIYHVETKEVCQITLFEHGHWPWSRPRPSGHISLPLRFIEKLAGTVDNFFVATATDALKFHRDYVRISILERPMAEQQDRGDALPTRASS